VVATSPKRDYCITGDTYVGGVPNTPNQTSPPQSDCTDPNAPLGWSVGWADQYDQTDSGQPISLSGVPDGTYILHAVVDPQHVLLDRDPANNVTDTKLEISGTSVAVLSQSHPITVPPTVTVTQPTNGTTVSGTVTLAAAASAPAAAAVRSVQFLLDGQPLGPALTTTPYTYAWRTGSVAIGSHRLSARVTDSNGNIATAAVVTLTVRTSTPTNTAALVSITNPAPGETVSGVVPVAGSTTDALAVAAVQYLLDGKPLGGPVSRTPYATSWNTTLVTPGRHTLTAVTTDTNGQVFTSAPISVTVQNPAPPMTCFVLQTQVTAHGTDSVATAPFHTATAREELIAFVSADGPSAGGQAATVTGSGLTWTLVRRANAAPGDAEIWAATAPRVLDKASVQATLRSAGYHLDLTVIAIEGVSGVGATAAASGDSGVAHAALTTTHGTSLVFAVGHRWDSATPTTLATGWVPLEQWSDRSTGDAYWSQYTNRPTGPAGSHVAVADLGPSSTAWNLAAVELVNEG
jgi:hypothetical protein